MVLMIMKNGEKELIGNDENGKEIMFVPPINFSNVEDRIYRCGFPQPSNFSFLETLHLKSVM